MRCLEIRVGFHLPGASLLLPLPLTPESGLVNSSLQIALLMLIASIAAFGVPFQSAVNAKLGEILQHRPLAAFLSFLGGTISLAIIVLITTPGLPKWPEGKTIPWYLLLGGPIGVVFVTTVLTIVPYIGVARVTAALVVGQLVMSVVIDHFGWMGVDQQSISLPRVFGCIALVGGLLLIQRG